MQDNDRPGRNGRATSSLILFAVFLSVGITAVAEQNGWFDDTHNLKQTDEIAAPHEVHGTD